MSKKLKVFKNKAYLFNRYETGIMLLVVIFDWWVFMYNWVILDKTTLHSLKILAVTALISYVLYVLTRKQILYRLTGLRYEWVKAWIESGIYICPECGSPLEVQQTVKDTGNDTKLVRKCPFCNYYSNRTVLGSNVEYKDISIIDNETF